HDYFYTGEMVEAESYRVEGIGEDFLPSTLDFSVIDDIVQVSDRECFAMTRRLVREEGLFIGGSCGAAVAGALKYLRRENLGPEKTVVVLLPDSGSRYLSKIFNDDWMRENGFLGYMGCEGTVADVLSSKPPQELITVNSGDRMTDVIKLLKTHSISQTPVVYDGKLVGLVREVDLLNHMLHEDPDHVHSADETIEEIIQSDVPNVTLGTPLEVLMSMFSEGNDVLLVMDPTGQVSDVQGILTKIDVLDYVYNNCL
ncbi:MAG: pyridoxal-phosphate dependent enzyme, partial [Chloroflexi bacterium]|nr:pyridoxal-phosphate dependent enzyme [Chloroflexota bacterium]